MAAMSLMWLVVSAFNICKSICLLWLCSFISDVWECQDGAFKCTNGRPRCIDSKLLCDSSKHLHCHDGSDEKSCGKYTKPCYQTKIIWLVYHKINTKKLRQLPSGAIRMYEKLHKPFGVVASTCQLPDSRRGPNTVVWAFPPISNVHLQVMVGLRLAILLQQISKNR